MVSLQLVFLERLTNHRKLPHTGSNGGTCKALAYHMLETAAAHGCHGKIGVLNEIANGEVPKDGPVIIVTASYEGNVCSADSQFVNGCLRCAAFSAHR
jgi:hypothetical protein